MNIEISKLSNGLTVVTDPMAKLESAALGVWVPRLWLGCCYQLGPGRPLSPLHPCPCPAHALAPALEEQTQAFLAVFLASHWVQIELSFEFLACLPPAQAARILAHRPLLASFPIHCILMLERCRMSSFSA